MRRILGTTLLIITLAAVAGAWEWHWSKTVTVNTAAARATAATAETVKDDNPATAEARQTGRERGEKAGYADGRAGNARDPRPGAFSAVAARETTADEENAYRTAYDAAYRAAYERARPGYTQPIWTWGGG